MRKPFYLLCATATLLFAGCASKEPMDYLPEATFYMAMNMQVADSQPGAKRLFDSLQKMQVEAGANEKLTKMYMAFTGPQAGQPKFYGIMMGQAGMRDAGFAEAKKAGATETKVSGRKAVEMKPKGTDRSVLLVDISDTGMAMVSTAADFEVMMKTAKKKNPAALAHAPFQKLMGLTGSHAIAASLNAGQFISQMGPQLQMLSALSPKGKEAIEQVQTIALTLDWDQQPVVEAIAYATADQGKEIANLGTMGLQMVKASGKAGPAAGVLESLQVKSDAEGAKFTLALPKEPAEQALTKLESGIANLPADPQARQQAIQAAVMSAVMSSGIAGGGAGRGGAPTQQFPGSQPPPGAMGGQPQMAPGAAFTPAPAVPGYTPAGAPATR